MSKTKALALPCALAAQSPANDVPVITLPSSRDLALLRAIRLPEVLHLTGLSRSTWYALQNPRDAAYDPATPKPFKLGKSPNSPSVWWAWQVIAYLEAKSATRING